MCICENEIKVAILIITLIFYVWKFLKSPGKSIRATKATRLWNMPSRGYAFYSPPWSLLRIWWCSLLSHAAERISVLYTYIDKGLVEH